MLIFSNRLYYAKMWSEKSLWFIDCLTCLLPDINNDKMCFVSSLWFLSQIICVIFWDAFACDSFTLPWNLTRKIYQEDSLPQLLSLTLSRIDAWERFNESCCCFVKNHHKINWKHISRMVKVLTTSLSSSSSNFYCCISSRRGWLLSHASCKKLFLVKLLTHNR